MAEQARQIYKVKYGMDNKEFVFQNEEKEKRADELIIANAPIIVWDTQYKITRFNKAFESITGRTEKDVIGKSLEILFPSANRDSSMELIRKAQQGERWETIEINILHVDSSVRIVLWNSASVLAADGKTTIATIAQGQDITERRKAENILEKTMQNLEKSNQELEQFAYVASHDLQEPLRMVSNFAQLLERRYKDKLDQDANDFIQYAVDGANRMQKLINDLLDYSRITSRGKDFAKVDISQLLGQTISNLQQLIIENTALITNEDLPELKADESQIIRVFQNLIENAIKFKKKSELPKIHISCKKKENFYEFAVRDNGIGMNMQFHDRVFTIFQRLHSKEEYPGTGIGLSICKRIVERHGGKIWFESKENEGTTFYFTIPYNTELEEKRVVENIIPADKAEYHVKRLKILIADDDEISEMLITRAIKIFCKEVLKVSTGVEAVETCRNNPDIDLVLMDIKMPEMGGYEATRQIRQFNTDVVIIAQTAYALSGDREKAMEAGCNDYISKPLDMALLKATIIKHFK